MVRPIIGVTPLWDSKLHSLWMLPGYFDALEDAGATPVMLPLNDDDMERPEQLVNLCDGFLFTGGHDVDPARYGEATGPHTVELCPARDRMETALLDAVLTHNKPVLGICRGIQLMNVALGGTLWQDLPSQHPGAVDHHGTAPYDRVVHTVTVTPGSPLARVLWGGAGRDDGHDCGQVLDRDGQAFHPEPYVLGVNSYHHQAIRRLADCLEPMATAPDGIVEAVWMPSQRFVWAVQWHPEFAHAADPAQQRIVDAFVAAAAVARGQ